MKTLYTQLPKEAQKEIKTIMNGNGYKVSDSEIYKDGHKVVLYIKKADKFISLDLEYLLD